jgi:hypothetical protein
MPLSGETSIPLDGAITLRLTQTVLQLKVARCRLTVSKPVSKAPMVSSLETIIS